MADISVAHESPHWRWTYLEAGRTLAEIAVLPLMRQLLNQAPMGDGHPVMVLPGFMAGDSSTGTMRRVSADTRVTKAIHGSWVEFWA